MSRLLIRCVVAGLSLATIFPLAAEAQTYYAPHTGAFKPLPGVAEFAPLTMPSPAGATFAALTMPSLPSPGGANFTPLTMPSLDGTYVTQMTMKVTPSPVVPIFYTPPTRPYYVPLRNW